MDVLSYLATGFSVALLPLNLLLVLMGCFIGTLIGSLPGIGPINGVAILLPLAYALGLPPESALILLAGVYYGAEYGGRISSILLNVPGDAGAIMTTLDGYPLSRKGEGGRALALSAVSSFAGSMGALLLMVFTAPLLSQLAIKFGPSEYVWLMVFAFTCLATMVGSRPVKTLVGVVIGLLLATVGIDSGTGVLRFTMGIPNFFDGIDFLVVVIGMFAISEVFVLLESWARNDLKITPVGKSFVTFADLVAVKWVVLRSTLSGFLIGVLPGTGASIASAVAYGTEKRFAEGKDEHFGEGDIRGLAAPEAANNASAAGAMVPMLTLGIPGSGTTAILLGALMMFNITPGPLLFEQRPEIAWGLIASMFVGNIALLVMNLPMIGLFVRLLSIRQAYLVPVIVMLTFIGIYSIHGDSFDLFFMVVLGVIGFILRKLHFSLAPVILGLVLGEVLEENLRRALSISGGDWNILLNGPMTYGLAVATVLAIVAPLSMRVLKKRKTMATAAEVDE
ncbi:tripartite tricarboxylate transporter permease [Neptunomonas phycophila]|jgi:putative tricarboxylic transport membrane protein|uniref:Tripartite tricarboxylate transporter permease n=1 Tax=Neptunomonas phycophila TaxID=1572645 RepID=A0AAW7XFL9_9GAMM|nr:MULTISPECIES: tripartite tricarboxylate transporter permease [Neptunomonas]MBT3146307.1 tripartite tricarboxylate transporter permease [Neptunomonas phycophila]MDN2659517.1 tripartite tricarboxylate transporter permease [Neptunomonas sp. CHC150]MDO6452059.1 tripartite tricarboxylate transporter permease [Neptunomonas phycophila]MDO6466612.1 tripartite tricarboxylate transporter permease [Neptunomonas phycophila]MDO6783024.1 tripartite tricarboxylate transporter permease [Neptunomonas phycop